MRTDIKFDRKQVSRLPNATHLGYDKGKTQTGDIVRFIEGGTERVGRIIGRIKNSADTLCVAALSADLTSVMERWVKPEDILQVYDPQESSRHILETIQFFFGPQFVKESVNDLRDWSY